MLWKILNMADVSPCPDVFKPLEGIAEVVSVPADKTALLSGSDVISIHIHLTEENRGIINKECFDQYLHDLP